MGLKRTTRITCQKFLETLWYGRCVLRWILWPFSLIYQIIAGLYHFYLKAFCQVKFSIPVIVVGNITVGGVGKTPLVIALVKACLDQGLHVGVVSRGYKASIKKFPHDVCFSDSPKEVGDEPLLIARKTGCPVIIAPKRVDAVRYLLEKYHSQIIISDDGLQHYAMGRAIEIVVIDGLRGLGNAMCLPAGPLRENHHRLQEADFLVVTGKDTTKQWPGAYSMMLQPGQLTQLTNGQVVAKNHLLCPIAAIAGIGHPARFFATLTEMGICYHPYAFPDHYLFAPDDLQLVEQSIVMTEKDAVKCQTFAKDTWYFLPIDAKLSDDFWQALWTQLKGYY